MLRKIRPVGDVYEEYMTAPPHKEGIEFKAMKVTLRVVKHELVRHCIEDKREQIVPVVEPISYEYV